MGAMLNRIGRAVIWSAIEWVSRKIEKRRAQKARTLRTPYPDRSDVLDRADIDRVIRKVGKR